MITPIQDPVVDIIRANVNSIADISHRLARIARLRDALSTLLKEAEAAKPIDFPYWAHATYRGSCSSRLWIRADVCEEAHLLAMQYVSRTQKGPWGTDECGNEANPFVPYLVYLIDGSGGDVWRRMRDLLGEAGELIPGMGNTDKAHLQSVLAKV